jgi:hypothetical protein
MPHKPQLTSATLNATQSLVDNGYCNIAMYNLLEAGYLADHEVQARQRSETSHQSRSKSHTSDTNRNRFERGANTTYNYTGSIPTTTLQKGIRSNHTRFPSCNHSQSSIIYQAILAKKPVGYFLTKYFRVSSNKRIPKANYTR